MEVAVHLAQAPAAAFQLPAPGERTPLDFLQHRAVALGVAVGNAEQALAVAEEIADAAHVQAWIGAAHAVDCDEVVAQRVGPREIRRPKRAARLQPQQVVGVLPAVDELGQHEELLGVAERTRARRSHAPRPRRAMPRAWAAG